MAWLDVAGQGKAWFDWARQGYYTPEEKPPAKP